VRVRWPDCGAMLTVPCLVSFGACRVVNDCGGYVAALPLWLSLMKVNGLSGENERPGLHHTCGAEGRAVK
jgi:hypothetical protein